MSEEVAKVNGSTEVAIGFATASSFELMQRGAKLLAASSLVPEEYRGNIPNCTIALNMANRIGADPLMVMQNLYVVHGRPGWSSQFLIATFNQSGRFSSLRYEYFGEKDKDGYGCRAWAVEKDTGQRLTGSDITVGLAKIEGWYGRNGSKWKTMPQQMLAYRAAAWFIRTHAPEIAMGLRTVEEIEDMPGEVNITSKATEIERSPEPASKLDALTDTLRQNGAGEKRKPGRPEKVESAEVYSVTAQQQPELSGLEFESPNPFQP